jgi:hypothetical protein
MGELKAASRLESSGTVGGQADVDAAPCPLVCRSPQTPQPTSGSTGVCQPLHEAGIRYRPLGPENRSRLREVSTGPSTEDGPGAYIAATSSDFSEPDDRLH